MLWETHDFYLDKIGGFEKEYTLLTRELSLQEKKLAFRIKKVSTKLEELYRKHLHSLQELRYFYKHHPTSIPLNRQINPQSLTNLYTSTALLLKAQQQDLERVLGLLGFEEGE